MARTLRLSSDLEQALKQLAAKHQRSEHGEIMFALQEYVSKETVSTDKILIDTIRSEGDFSLFLVKVELGINKGMSFYVRASNAYNARMFICNTVWIQLSALTAVQIEE